MLPSFCLSLYRMYGIRHEKLLKKVFHARINESIKQYKDTAMASQKGITGVDFRKGLKACGEQKKKKGNTEKKEKD